MEGDILTKYIERMGTGTVDTIKRCRNFGLDEPEFAFTDGFVVTIRRKPDRHRETTFAMITGRSPIISPWTIQRKNPC